MYVLNIPSVPVQTLFLLLVFLRFFWLQRPSGRPPSLPVHAGFPRRLGAPERGRPAAAAAAAVSVAAVFGAFGVGVAAGFAVWGATAPAVAGAGVAAEVAAKVAVLAAAARVRAGLRP